MVCKYQMCLWCGLWCPYLILMSARTDIVAADPMMVLQLRLLLSKFGESHAQFLKTFVFENYFNKKYWVQYSHMVLCEMPIMPPLCTALNEYRGTNSFLFKMVKVNPLLFWIENWFPLNIFSNPIRNMNSSVFYDIICTCW